MKLTGKQSWVFEHKLYVNAEGTAAGPKEKKAQSVISLIKPMMKCTVIKRTGKWLKGSSWMMPYQWPYQKRICKK